MNNIVCVESESVSAQKKRVIIEELLKGQEAATQLKKVLLENPFRSEGSLSSQELMANVLRSFTEALAVINSSNSSDEVAHLNLLNSGQNGSPVTGSGEKRSQKGGRGRYNRRKSGVSWTIISCTTDDNHAWRKYGQKGVLNSEFPRSYFRCCYKYDQGCRANKQVQRDQENPNMYRTTYIGIHTCNATSTLKATQSATDSTTWEPYLLKSDTDYSKVPNQPSFTIKQPFPKENTSSLKDFEPSKPTIVPIRMESDDNNNADNVYSFTDSQRLDVMDFGVSSVHFGTDFPFDEGVTSGAVTIMTKVAEVPNVQDHHISSPSLTIKQEFPKKDTPSDVADHKYLDPNLWSDLKDFQPFKPNIMPLKMESDDNNNR